MSNWISVEERLPEEGLDVWVASNLYVCIARRSGTGKWINKRFAGEIRYWQLLPDPSEQS